MHDNSVRTAGIVSATCTVICLAAVFFVCNMFPGQKLLFLKSDSLSQYAAYSKMFWRHLLAGEGVSWSFELGMGAPSWSHYCFYALSPINVFFMLFDNINTAAYAVFVFKATLSAAFFSLFLSYCIKCRFWMNITFSIAYSLCGFCINNYTEYILLDSLYILPIICLYIFKLHSDGSWKGLCICYAYSFIAFFYGGYQCGIFSFILFWCMGRYMEIDRTEWRRSVSGYIKSVILALLISGIVILPVFRSIILEMRGTDSVVGDWKAAFLWEHMVHMLTGTAVDPYQDVPVLFCGMLTPVLMMVLLLEKESVGKKLSLIIPILFILLCSFLGPAYIMIHGFDQPDGITYRFMYFYAFIVCSYAAMATTKRCNSIRVLKMGVIILAFAVISVVMNNISPRYGRVESMTVQLAVFLACIEILLYCRSNRNKIMKILLPCIMLIDCFINAVFTIMPKSATTITELSEYMEQWEKQADIFKQYLINDEEYGSKVFRADFENSPTSNIAVMEGIRSEQLYSSIENKRIRNSLYNLGYMAFNKFLSNVGATPPMRMLFSSGYVLHFSNPKYEESDAYNIIKENRVLPLAYMVDEKTEEYSTMECRPFDNINRLFSCMIGRELSVFELYSREIDLNNDNMLVSAGEDGSVLFEIQDKTKSGRTEIISDSEAGTEYIYFSQNEPEYRFDSANIYSEVEWGTVSVPPLMKAPFILKMANRDGLYRCNVYLNPDLAISDSCKSISLATLNNKKMVEFYNELCEGAMEVESFEESEIRGHIKVGQNKKLMFTSIPYDDGWEVRVNGNKVDVLDVLEGSFMAIKLDAGEYDIVMKYRDRWLEKGCAVSIVGIGLLLLSFILDAIKVYKSNNITSIDKTVYFSRNIINFMLL